MKDWGDILDAELAWRDAEMASLKLLVAEAPTGSARQVSLLRALWTMLYAHYEGFCKFVWDFYLESLEDQGVTRGVCCVPVARFSMSKRFRELRGNLSDGALWDACTSDFQNWMNEQLRFDLRLETESNLWPELLKRNSSDVDLPSKMVEEHEFKLKALVARRNEIAHGKKMIISSLAEYQQYEEAAMLVMHELAVAVLNCLENKTYLKA